MFSNFVPFIELLLDLLVPLLNSFGFQIVFFVIISRAFWLHIFERINLDFARDINVDDKWDLFMISNVKSRVVHELRLVTYEILCIEYPWGV